MYQPETGKTGVKPRILLAPLDWGLGHATRCIPLIRELLDQGADVTLAGEGPQAHLLQAEFPGLALLPLKGYRVKYSRSAAGLLWSMLVQSPKILRSIRRERAWLSALLNEQSFDAVISDNRFGLYHASIPCVFMTHQLTIKSPLGKWSEKIIQRRNYRYINRFNECWIPDMPGENNLAGDLSHPLTPPATKTRYTGPLSRFTKTNDAEKKGHLLIVLSGPEPQRSIFENKIIEQVSHYNGTATIVRGLPGNRRLIPSTNMLQFYNHLPAPELNKEMMEAEYVIGRSGYSTVMDLAALEKKSILVPTPGQTEQEYLAGYLQQRRLAYTVSQKDFSLTNDIAKAAKLAYRFNAMPVNDRLKETVAAFIRSLSKMV
jgi:UDP:flavonoid glycosyltransferase YjiC (YdhE family)